MKNTKFLVLIIVLIGLCVTVYSFWDVCLTFLTAAVLAYLLNPLARLISRKLKIRHGLSVALVLVLFLGIVAVLLSILIPYAVTQIRGLVRDISAYAGNFDEMVDSMLAYLEQLPISQEVLDKAAGLLVNVDTYLASVFSAVLTWLVGFSTGIFDIIVIAFLLVYFMLDGAKLTQGFLGALPHAPRQGAKRIMTTSNRLIQKYIKSRVLIALGMAIVTYIGFSIMGLKYAALFAVLSFVLDFVPYFGSLLAGGIEAVFALITGGIGLALTVIIFVLVVQQIEGNVVAPKVEGEATGIHPVTVMFTLLCSNQLFGPIGMLISTPIAVVIKTVLTEAWRYIVSPDDYNPDQLVMENFDA